MSKATVSYHVRRLELPTPGDYVGRRAMVATLGYSGVRVSELCDMRIRHLRLHDPAGARFHIPDAKTEVGIREVQISPELVDHLVGHLDRLRRENLPTDPDAFVFPNVRGGRVTRQRVAEVVRDAAAKASERLVARKLPPLPVTTPHSLRRTYISIPLLATRFDVLFVMSQVGHADSKMTTDVYAQLQNRIKREHGSAFDRLVARAREQLHGVADPGSRRSLGQGLGHEAFEPPSRTSSTSGPRSRKSPTSRLVPDGETRTRTGDTTIFSRVLYQLSYLALRGW